MLRFHGINKSIYSLQVEAGDVLLKVNGTDVNRFTTREGKIFAIYQSMTLIFETYSLDNCFGLIENRFSTLQLDSIVK